MQRLLEQLRKGGGCVAYGDRGTGKTSALVTLGHELEYHGKRVVIVVPFLNLVAHTARVSKELFPTRLPLHVTNKVNGVSGVGVVLADEWHLFTEEQRRYLRPMIFAATY